MPIAIDPDMGGDKPTVAGTRISVQTVLGYLSAADSMQDVPACLEDKAVFGVRRPSIYPALKQPGLDPILNCPARAAAKNTRHDPQP